MPRDPNETRSLRGFLFALGLVSSMAVHSPSPALALEEIIDPIFEAGTSGGTFGYRVRRIDGPVVANVNPGFVFYPASTIKVLQHLSVMRYVEDGTLDLFTSTVDVCTATTNCSDDPNLSVASCSAAPKGLSLSLQSMMKLSDNQDTNAIQELIGSIADPASAFPSFAGRTELFDFSTTVIGMSPSTELHHKFACDNVDNDPSNSATLLDLELLYDAIAVRPSVLLPQTRVLLKDRMKNESSPDLAADLLAVVDEEAAAAFKGPIADEFKNLVYMIYKAGDVSNDGEYVSNAGLIQLPTYNGASKRLHIWGAFVEDADSYVNLTVTDACIEMLRPAIRSAILTWNLFPLTAKIQSEAEEVERLGKLARSRMIRARLIAAARSLRAAAPGSAQGYLTGVDGYYFQLALRLIQAADAVHPSLGAEPVLQRLVGLSEHMADNALADATAAGSGEDLSERLAAIASDLARAKADARTSAARRGAIFGQIVHRSSEITGDRRKAEAPKEAGFPVRD